MSKVRTILSGMAVFGSLLAPAFAGTPLALFDRVENGRWELKPRGGLGPIERVCLRDPQSLLQLRHPRAQCERIVLTDAANEVVVQYTCRGAGYGRTSIRRETARLVQIETQGIADGLPFALAAEARKVGDCASS